MLVFFFANIPVCARLRAFERQKLRQRQTLCRMFRAIFVPLYRLHFSCHFCRPCRRCCCRCRCHQCLSMSSLHYPCFYLPPFICCCVNWCRCSRTIFIHTHNRHYYYVYFYIFPSQIDNPWPFCDFADDLYYKFFFFLSFFLSHLFCSFLFLVFSFQSFCLYSSFDFCFFFEITDQRVVGLNMK